MYNQLSPNMLKTFDECPCKFDFKYLRDIQMPVNDEIFEFGKNIHALASYYLRNENIEKMEKALTPKEVEVWTYLKGCKYFSYEVINTEYNLAVKIGKHFFGGRLDALVKNGDKYYILDYKTGSAPKNAKYDFQTMIYILAVSEFFKTNDINFVYIDLKHREDVIISFASQLKEEYKQRLLDISNKIDNYDSAHQKAECKNLTGNNSNYACEYSLICY